MVSKKWKPEFRTAFDDLHQLLRDTESFTTESLQTTVKGFINDHGYKFGNILPILRLGLTGTTKGPDIFATMALLGRAEVDRRLQASYQRFDQLTQE
jgi:glutamyl-tRNA synthetase